MSLFEPISEDEFKRATKSTSPQGSGGKKSKSIDTTVRNQNTWFKLPHFQSFCTVPGHDEHQRTMSPEKKEYRQVYPVRMVCTIGDFDVCRDCYIGSIDLS